jgi:arylsulfatase A-like enzyme
MKVLILNASSLHVGYLGCYGNEWTDTPHLDRLAAESVVFDRHYADDLGHERAEPASLTGRFHFPQPDNAATEKVEGQPDLWSILKESGIAFRHIHLAHKEGKSEDRQTSALGSVQQALKELGRLKPTKDWLLWVDLPSLAPPWSVPEEILATYFPHAVAADEEPTLPWLDPPIGPLSTTDEEALERLQNTYAGVVTFFDRQLGVLRDALEQHGLMDELFFCLAASCGLSLGEHGIVGPCRPWLHEEVVHVPLIVRLPRAAAAGRRVMGLTQPVDLLPTLLEALEVAVPSWVQGHSIWPLIRGEREEVRSYACTGMRVHEAIEWALRAPKWACILPVFFAADDARREPQLYVKPDDRWEVNNVRQHHQELAEHMEEVLRAFVASTRQPGPLQAPELRDVEGEPPLEIPLLSGDQA